MPVPPITKSLPILFDREDALSLAQGSKKSHYALIPAALRTDAKYARNGGYGRWSAFADGPLREASRFQPERRLLVHEPVRLLRAVQGPILSYVADGVHVNIRSTDQQAFDRWQRTAPSQEYPPSKMPTFACRFELVITDWRVLPVQNITRSDALALGTPVRGTESPYEMLVRPGQQEPLPNEEEIGHFWFRFYKKHRMMPVVRSHIFIELFTFTVNHLSSE